MEIQIHSNSILLRHPAITAAKKSLLLSHNLLMSFFSPGSFSPPAPARPSCAASFTLAPPARISPAKQCVSVGQGTATADCFVPGTRSAAAPFWISRNPPSSSLSNRYRNVNCRIAGRQHCCDRPPEAPHRWWQQEEEEPVRGRHQLNALT